MTWLAFGFGMVVGALIAATYWATQYWESQRQLGDAVARDNRMKELLNQTQNLLMERNRQLDGIKEVLSGGDIDDYR